MAYFEFNSTTSAAKSRINNGHRSAINDQWCRAAWPGKPPHMAETSSHSPSGVQVSGDDPVTGRSIQFADLGIGGTDSGRGLGERSQRAAGHGQTWVVRRGDEEHSSRTRKWVRGSKVFDESDLDNASLGLMGHLAAFRWVVSQMMPPNSQRYKVNKAKIALLSKTTETQPSVY